MKHRSPSQATERTSLGSDRVDQPPSAATPTGNADNLSSSAHPSDIARQRARDSSSIFSCPSCLSFSADLASLKAELERLQKDLEYATERRDDYNETFNMPAVLSQIDGRENRLSLQSCVEHLIEKIDTERVRAEKRALKAEAELVALKSERMDK